MPFLAPLGATVLGAAGVAGPVTAGAAAVAGTATVAAAGAAAYGVRSSIVGSNNARKAANNAAADMAGANAKAIADAKLAQTTSANQASEAMRSRQAAMSRSQSVYTSPLGISGQATTARKTLLGQ